MRLVLDTNVVIAAMNGEEGVRRRLEGVPADSVGLPLPVLAELHFGARRSSRSEENLAKIAGLRATFRVLLRSTRTAELYGRVRADLAARGFAKSDFDLLIACAALEASALLITRDAALLDGRIEGLRATDWRDG